MDGLGVLLLTATGVLAAGVTWLLIALADAIGAADDREIDELTLDAIETLRQIIERETGREVAELFLHGGIGMPLRPGGRCRSVSC